MESAQLTTTPAGRPPPGVIPNYNNPHSNGPIFIAVGSVFVALMLICVVVRGYTKFKIAGKLTPDDYTCVLAALGAILYFIINTFAVTVGHWGRHMWDLTLADLESDASSITAFFSDWTFWLFIMFAKLTFFLLYLQLFKPMIWLRYASYAGATFTILFYTGLVIFSLAVTSPAPKQSWQDVSQGPGQQAVWRRDIEFASVGLVLDIFILVLPIAGVNRLQLSRRRKLGVVLVFLTGGIACIASSLGIYYRWRQKHQNSADVTYEIVPVFLACTVEICVGVIASCMPSMSSFIRHTNWTRLTPDLSFRIFQRYGFGNVKSWGSDNSLNKGRKAHYADLEGMPHKPGSQGYETAPVKLMRTYIRTGKTDEIGDDGIHLKYDIEQEPTPKYSRVVRP